MIKFHICLEFTIHKVYIIPSLLEVSQFLVKRVLMLVTTKFGYREEIQFTREERVLMLKVIVIHSKEVSQLI